LIQNHNNGLFAENAALEKDIKYLKVKLAYVEAENNNLLDQLSELITNNPLSFSITRELLQALEEPLGNQLNHKHAV